MKRTIAVAIASLALLAAGCGDEEDTSTNADVAKDTNTGTAATPAPPATEGRKSTNLKISADPSELKFDKTSLSAKAGKVTITMDNPAEIPHAVGIEGNGVDSEGQVVNKGEKSKATADLKPGTYEFYCPVPGHEEAGMKGELTVK